MILAAIRQHLVELDILLPNIVDDDTYWNVLRLRQFAYLEYDHYNNSLLIRDKHQPHDYHYYVRLRVDLNDPESIPKIITEIKRMFKKS